ncbi:MAG: hypothetical protein BMS9Abin33_1277 [Gammaproteobacteria bacterium]|nr:MAG: hypothetical protein BMS9Abin33_1277 [Gammaproteobacteria bacterium]
MHITKYFFRLLLTPVLFFWVAESYALGLGITTGSGSEEWDHNYIGVSSFNHDGDREIRNFGFVLDTAVARNALFNYRFSFVAEKNSADRAGLDMKGVAMTHDFGFALFRNKAVRVWLGPRVKVSYFNDITQTLSSSSTDGNVVGIGFGPVFGINIHLPEVASFSITAGTLRGGYVGEYETSPVYTFNDLDVDSRGGFVNFSVLFRIRDNY